jgi:prepilin-type N-terminal cleavage/methylation domain-containing protein
MDSNKLERNGIDLRNQGGFTLLEIMSVLVILGVVFSVTIQKFTSLSDTAYQKALQSAVQELNIRETLIWSNFKISSDGWPGDEDVFKSMDTKLGGRYSWDPSAGSLGGKLRFGPHYLDLTRTPSQNNSAAYWK